MQFPGETGEKSRQKQCVDGALLFQDNFILLYSWIDFSAAVFVSFIPG